MRARWQAATAGAYRGQIGEYDREVALALRFGWTPEQISRMSRAFLDELTERMLVDNG